MATFSHRPPVELLAGKLQPGEEIISINANETDEHKSDEDMAMQVSAALYNRDKLPMEEIETCEIKVLRRGWIKKPKQPHPLTHTIGSAPLGLMWVVYTKTQNSKEITKR
jgi:hypothetical protein